MVKSKNFLIAKRYNGMPKVTDFKLVEEELPDLKDEEFRIEAVAWSVDPYLRSFLDMDFPLNSVMMGGQVARVIETKNPNYKVGDYLYAHIGWRTHSIVDQKFLESDIIGTYRVPDYKGLSVSHALGTLGITGITAYFGFLEICHPKEGETVVVSTAAGAVGNVVGQIAKLKGCKVIGITGSEDKVRWLEDELKFDKAINYKTEDIAEELKKAAPNGIDCYFDNVGGTTSSIVISQMNLYGRISASGYISSYNDDSDQEPLAPAIQKFVVLKQLKMEGFSAIRWHSRWTEAILQLLEWVLEGKIKTRETVTVGFVNLPQAFIDLLEGKNIGKAVVMAE